METISYIVMGAIVIMFVVNKTTLSYFHSIAKQILQTAPPISFDAYGDFPRYYLANSGLFVGRFCYPLVVAKFSVLHSLSFPLLLIIIIVNIFALNLFASCMAAIILVVLYKSNTARSFPLLNNLEREAARSVDNFLLKNKDFNGDSDNFLLFASTMEDYYRHGLKITYDYFAR